MGESKLKYKDKKKVNLDFRKCKVGFFGLDGSGKSHTLKDIIQKRNYEVLVWTYDKSDYKNLKNFFLWKDVRKENFSDFCFYARRLAELGYIDGIVIDDFDFLFQGNERVPETFNYLITQPRHSNIFVCVTAKRPQDIKTGFIESCQYICSFKLSGENAKKKFNNIHKGLGDLIINLKYEMESPYNHFVAVRPNGEIEVYT